MLGAATATAGAVWVLSEDAVVTASEFCDKMAFAFAFPVKFCHVLVASDNGICRSCSAV